MVEIGQGELLMSYSFFILVSSTNTPPLFLRMIFIIDFKVICDVSKVGSPLIVTLVPCQLNYIIGAL